jgi:multisubunit Na+/H+ antiporter MnhB subunit
MPEPTTELTVVPHPAVTQAAKETSAAEGGQTNSTPEQNPRLGDAVMSTAEQGVEPKAPVSGYTVAQPPDSEKPFSLKDIQVGKPDGRGLPITYVYAVEDNEYAIYQAGEVMVHFADDPAKAQVQRKSILPISSARAEINALVQGLVYREVCDRQLAYALQLALDGDTDGAKATIAAAKAFVLARRAARGRFQYLKWSFGAAAVMIGLLFLASRLYPFREASSDLWLAAKAGLIGAAFSIALAIRNRTVALDTELLANVTDGTLRLLIGVISAGVLLLLLACGILPSLKIGDANFSGSTLTWQMVLIIGFVGGFLERLVPDLLEKKNPQGNGNTNAIDGGPTR